MAVKSLNGFFEREPATTFNMTPVIDIVFQLIIFFALVCKFIEAENFAVAVPADCRFAQSDTETQAAMTTVTVMKESNGESSFAVGPDKVLVSNRQQVADKLAALISERLKQLPEAGKVVTLRIDKDVPYAEAQYALAGIAASSATDIRLSVFRAEQAGEEPTLAE